MSEQESPKVPKLPDLKLSENTVSQALNSLNLDQENLQVNKVTMEHVNISEQRQLSPRSPRRLHQLTELKDDLNIEIKPRLRRISNRDRTSESSTRTASSSTTTTTTTTNTSTTSFQERSLHVSSSSESISMKAIGLTNSSVESSFSSSLEHKKVKTAYEDHFQAIENTTDKISTLIKQLNDIKALQDQRNQQILENNNKLVLLCNQRRQKIQRIYHQNYLMKKAYLRKKHNNELRYLYQKRQRDIELLQLEQKKRRQKKYVQLKKQMRQQKIRKIRLLQIQQREAQIEQVQEYYLKRRENYKKKLFLLSLNSKVTNYSQTEDPSPFSIDEDYSNDYYSDDEQEIGTVNIQERAININFDDENQQQVKAKQNENIKAEEASNNSEQQAKSNGISTKNATENDLNANQANERNAQLDSNETDFSELLTKGAICFVLAATIFRAFQVAF